MDRGPIALIHAVRVQISLTWPVPAVRLHHDFRVWEVKRRGQGDRECRRTAWREACHLSWRCRRRYRGRSGRHDRVRSGGRGVRGGCSS